MAARWWLKRNPICGTSVPDDQIWVSRYALEASGTLNARSSRNRFEGALIRRGAGFGCLQTWPELGDPTLEECLVDLAGACEFPLVRKTLACIEADGRARGEGRSLFEGLTVPRSHATLATPNDDGVAEAVSRGFTCIKTKAGRNLDAELETIRRLAGEWPDLRWRIDFNETAHFEELVGALEKWSAEELAVIDFLEDPLTFQPETWARLREATGLALANDRHQAEDEGLSEVLIVKPAVDVVVPASQQRVFTSYMDHPLGQCFAAWEAAVSGTPEICGLQTHGLFEPDAFSEELGVPGPEFVVPTGPGLGFGDLLETLKWTRL